MRGQESVESATKSSAAFCLSFLNTATVPAIPWLELYYNCDCTKEPVAFGAVSQSMNGRVINTCNLSEDWVGYSTRYGDSVGDMSPLSKLTVQEVKAIGRELNLPTNLVDKTPADGLCQKSDEDNLGFTYEVLDKYIREGLCDDQDTKARIDYLHTKNKFKLESMPVFQI